MRQAPQEDWGMVAAGVADDVPSQPGSLAPGDTMNAQGPGGPEGAGSGAGNGAGFSGQPLEGQGEGTEQPWSAPQSHKARTAAGLPLPGQPGDAYGQLPQPGPQTATIPADSCRNEGELQDLCRSRGSAAT